MFAVIFDMDGVIIDDLEYHLKAWQIFLRKHNVDLTRENLRDNLFGRGNKEIFKIVFQRTITEKEYRIMGNEKEFIFREIYQNQVQPVTGLTGFLDELKTKNIQTGIATSAPRENVDFILTEIGITDQFDVIIDSSHVSKSKPDPEVYLLTSSALNVAPARCIVIEDSLNGIRSAKNAGMKVIAITTSLSENQLPDVDMVIKDFTELDMDRLENLV